MLGVVELAPALSKDALANLMKERKRDLAKQRGTRPKEYAEMVFIGAQRTDPSWNPDKAKEWAKACLAWQEGGAAAVRGDREQVGGDRALQVAAGAVDVAHRASFDRLMALRPRSVAAQLEHRYNRRRWQRSFRPDASQRHGDG